MAVIQNFIIRFLSQGTGELDKNNKKVKELEQSFSSLQKTIAGIALGAFIADSVRAANAMTDLADATNISLQTIVGFTQAVAANGGTADKAADAISDLVKNLGDAATGSGELQKAFAAAGVSLEDLRTLSEEDILRKTVAGIARLGDAATQSSIKARIFGEALKTTDLGTVNAQYDDFVRNSRNSAEATRDAAEANRRFSESMTNLRQGAVDALQPILKLLGDQNVSVETATKLFQTLGVVIGIVYGAKLIAGMGTVLGLMKSINVALKAQFALQSSLAILTGPAGVALAVAAAAGGIVAYKALNETLKETNEELEKKNRLEAGTSTAGGGRGDGNIQMEYYRQLREVTDANEKAIQESRTRIEEANENARRIRALANANEIRKIEIESQFEIDKITREIKAKEGLNEQQKTAEIAARVKEIRVQAEVDIAEVRRQLLVRQFQEEEQQRQEDAQAWAEHYRQIDDARLQAFGNVEALRLQTQILTENSLLSRELVDASDEERRRREQILAIEQQRRASLADIKRLTLLPEDERLRREQEINAEYDRRIGLINEESQAIQRREQDFAAGFRDTMRRYEQSLTPLKRGEEFANSVFRNMDSALSNFVNNGKFNFKDFATSVIRDLVLIELRANTVSLFRNVLGAAGSALGFRAMGGPVTAGQPYVVGERGAELFVPSTSGTIVPNLGTSNAGALGGSSNVVYNINAVDALSFKQLVARDPSFIFAVTEQGRKSVPSTRR